MMADNINSLSDITKISEDIRSEVHKSIVGLTNHIDTLTLSLLTGGHVLLEGLPGTAKTFLAVSFSNTLSLENKRIQSTPDMMPGDVTGTRIYNPKTLEFDFHAGPIFANMVIVAAAGNQGVNVDTISPFDKIPEYNLGLVPVCSSP